MKHFILFLILGILSGCAATMVRAPGSSGSKFGPSNEATRPGMIKYLNQGAGTVIEARREDAYKQMHTACGGNYKILSEGPRGEGGSAYAIGNSVAFSSDEYWYISFECGGR